MEGLLDGWSRLDTEDERIVYGPESLRRAVEAGGATLVTARSGIAPRRFTQQQAELPARLVVDRRLAGSDVVVAANMTCSLIPGGPPVVGILHDVRHLRRPQDFSRSANRYRRIAWSRSARRMRAVVAVSEFSKDEAVELGLPLPDRVWTIPNGCDHVDSPTSEEVDDVVLCVAHRSSKGIDDLAAVWSVVHEQLGDAAPSLLVSGVESGSPGAASLSASFGRRALPTPRVIGYVSSAELYSTMSRSRAVLYLSHYEGFGLVPTESSALGRRTFAYDLAPYRERAEHLLLTTAPLGRPDLIGRRLVQYLAAERAETTPIDMPTWSQVAQQYRSALLEVVDGPR